MSYSNQDYSDESNLRFSATRFEQSPYYHLYANEKTALGMAAGRFYAAWNGEDIEQTYWNLKQKAVLYDVPEKPWQIEGPDVVAFLEKVFARRIGNLIEGRGRYAIACTPKGGTFMDGILFKMDQNRYWYVQPDGAFVEWLLAQSEGFDITVSDPNSRVLQVQGPTSMQLMSDATNGGITSEMKYFHSGFFDIGGQNLYVSRTGWTGELGYEIYSDNNTDHERLWNHLFKVGAPHGLTFGGLATMGIRRVEAGILDNLSDFDASMTPFEAGLGSFIDLDKPDFVGREALLSAHHETLLLGVKCDIAPEDGADVVDGNDCVGKITIGTWSPFLKHGIGYVRFNKRGDWADKTLKLKSSSGALVDCEILRLPFYDKEKAIPRAEG
ncbi:MAG: aminomethyltransferase family protein [Pseudomonadota bacterium]